MPDNQPGDLVSQREIERTTLSHWFDVLAEQVAYELPEVEASNRGVAGCQGGGVGFHAALTELASMFGMADYGLDTSAAVYKAGVGLRIPRRQYAGIEPRLLETKFFQPCQRTQILAIGTAVIAFVHPGRGRDAHTKKVLMFFDHRADGSLVFHP